MPMPPFVAEGRIVACLDCGTTAARRLVAATPVDYGAAMGGPWLPGGLELAAHAVTATLATWLALLVGTRSTAPASRVFCVVALSAAAWSTSILVNRLTTVPDVAVVARALEDIAVAVLVASTAHLALEIAAESRLSARSRVGVPSLYVANVLLALPPALDPQLSPPALAASGAMPDALFGWLWILTRLGTVLLGVAALARALRSAGEDAFRRRQLLAALASVGAGAIGAILRILPVVGDLDAWIGVAFVSLAVLLATYAVLAAGLFFGPVVADRAFRASIAGGLLAVAVMGLTVLLDALGRAALGLDPPILVILAVVAIVALYDPLAARIRRRSGTPASARLEAVLRAVAGDPLSARASGEAIEPALRRVATAVDVTGLTVVGADGSVLAGYGAPVTTSVIEPVPLLEGGRRVAELRVGPARSGATLSGHDQELLRLSAAFVAAALAAGRREDEQATSLADLTLERAAVQAQAMELHAALVAHQDRPHGLRVRALGPFQVERDGSAMVRWGGEKAGSRQAQALFAFLFDRGERGVTRDEVIDVLWPDADLERADLAFHRTLGGLRRTLDPERPGRASRAIRLDGERYRLGPGVIAWSDVEEFLDRLDRVADHTDPTERRAALEAAQRLYRGEYLEDCPIYGDSEYVLERRESLRERYVDLLVALADTRASGGDGLGAAGLYRDALRVSGGSAPRASEGLERLGL
jgi:hypothetical protein